MNCRFQNNRHLRQMPCNYVPHPHKKNIRYCTVCQDHYDIRDVGNEATGGIILTILGIIIMLVLML